MRALQHRKIVARNARDTGSVFQIVHGWPLPPRKRSSDGGQSLQMKKRGAADQSKVSNSENFGRSRAVSSWAERHRRGQPYLSVPSNNRLILWRLTPHVRRRKRTGTPNPVRTSSAMNKSTVGGVQICPKTGTVTAVEENEHTDGHEKGGFSRGREAASPRRHRASSASSVMSSGRGGKGNAFTLKAEHVKDR